MKRRKGRRRGRTEGPGSFIRPEGMLMHCERAGYWIVEGKHVERIKVNDNTVWWFVFERFTDQPERFMGKRRTLTEACALVWDIMIEEGRAS